MIEAGGAQAQQASIYTFYIMEILSCVIKCYEFHYRNLGIYVNSITSGVDDFFLLSRDVKRK